MNKKAQMKIPAMYIRGGTSKGVFFKCDDLPELARKPGAIRDAVLLRVIGSPDPYGKQTDGMGGATSSTSKIVILSKSTQDNHDVNYLFGQVAIDKAFIDWSGNCGNLSAAVGSFAVQSGLITAERIPENGVLPIRIWQENISKTIVAYVPIIDGQVQEIGSFELDGVTFPAAEVKLDFMSPAAEAQGDIDAPEDALLPTGNLIDDLHLPSDLVKQAGLKTDTLKVSMINAGIPTLFINAEDLGYSGTELQDDINSDDDALRMFELIRAYGAIKMGLIKNISEAATRQHTPKIAFVAKASNYVASSGKHIDASKIDLVVRALSMGKLHHAMMGTAAVAIGTAAAIPGTLVNLAAGGGQLNSVCFGHPSGTLTVGAEVKEDYGHWSVEKVSMSRSARVLMEGWVRVPASVVL
ncbi:MAG: 2-methylaconitate cis-trans isomerase PrpF [Cellvibrionaceae bacterium]